MSGQPEPYTEFHPRWYRKQVSTYWWMGSWRYLKFILRELSSVAVAWFVVMTLLQLRALASWAGGLRAVCASAAISVDDRAERDRFLLSAVAHDHLV